MLPNFRLLSLACTLMLGTVGAAQGQQLSDALALAYEHSPDLQSALLDARKASEDVSLAGAALRPNIGASIGGSYNWSLAGDDFTDSTALTTGLNYSQTLFDNHKTSANIEAAEAAVQIAEYQVRNVEQNILLAVVQAYYTVLSDRQRLALRQENLAFFQAQSASVRDRVAVGEGTRVELAQAEARLAQGDAMLRAAQNSLDVSQAGFQRHVGRAPQSLTNAHGFAPLLPNSLQAAIDEAAVSHPALAMAKAAIRAAQAGIDAAAASFGPKVSLNGSVGTRLSGPFGTAGDGLSGAIGVQLSVPLYAGGSMGATVRKANIEAIKSEVTAMGNYDQIQQSVIAAWAGMQSSDAQIAAARAGVAAGQQVLDGITQEYELGGRTILDVLNAQSELSSARDSLITAAANKEIAAFSLLAATGKLTANALNLPVTPKTASRSPHGEQDAWQDLR